MNPKITVEIDYNSLIILINKLPMLIIPIETLRGMQSWTDGNKYSIEFYFSDSDVVLSEFDTYEKWSSVLKDIYQINKKNKLF